MNLYRRPPGVLSETIDGSLVLIDESSAELLTLNGVGALVWESLATEDTSMDELVDAVLVVFPDAPQDSVSADVRTFLDELAHAGLVLVDS